MLNDGELAISDPGMACPAPLSTWLERTHNFTEREPITLAPTVERDLGKRRSAQRFLVVPW